MKQTHLIRKFSILFMAFALVTIICSGVFSYSFQTRQYRQSCATSLSQMTSFLSELIQKEGEEMVNLKNWFNEHPDEARIPLNFKEDLPHSEAAFNRYLKNNYPGKTFGVDLSFGDLDAEGQRLYFTYHFERWFTIFFNARDRFELSYVYFIYPDESKDHCMVYLFDATLTTVKTADGQEVLLLGDPVYEDPKQHKYMWQAWKTGRVPSGFDSLNNEFGYVYTYCRCVSIDGEKVGLLCADISVEKVRSEILHGIILQAGASAIVLILASIALFVFTRKQILNRVVNLEKKVQQYAETKDPAIAGQLTAAGGSNDEIHSLTERFGEMITELDDYMENLRKVTAEKERISAELNVAAKIQADLLPKIFPPFPERKEIDLFASMDPAKEVGGDFYDFFMVDDHRLALVIADVSGKGVPAALFMVIAKTLIKNRLMMGESPADALMNVNNQLCEENDAQMFVTVWTAVLDLDTGDVVEANAGHEYPAVLGTDGTYELIKTKHSPAIGVMDGLRFRQREFRLEPGQTVFVYTDGVTEATNTDLQLFGEKRLMDVLNRNTDKPVTELLLNVRREVDKFVGSAPQFDDLTMLGIQYRGRNGGETA